MNYNKGIALMGLCMTAIGLASTLFYNMSMKKRGQTGKAPAATNDVKNDGRFAMKSVSSHKRIKETVAIGNLHERIGLPATKTRLHLVELNRERNDGTSPIVSSSDNTVSATRIHGKAIYQPDGRAREFCLWACNLYNGCSNNCDYCFNNKSIMAGTLGGIIVSLKKSLVDTETAFEIFKTELTRWRSKIIKDGGLHFNFVSDPCLAETIELNFRCMDEAQRQGVPCQILTKCADWLDHPAVQNVLSRKGFVSVGFTLTGRDDLEPGASTNRERIQSMKELHNAGISTWASIEPIIDPDLSFEMIRETAGFCDHYKIGILSGKKGYTPQQIRDFVAKVQSLGHTSIYWKESLREFINKQ